MPPPLVAPSALIDFRASSPGRGGLRLAFGEPRERIEAHAIGDVADTLAHVEARARAGAWCVGHLRYEAAAAFDAALQTHPHAAADGPLLRFLVFDAPLSADDSATAWQAGELHEATLHWQALPDRAAFDAAIDRSHRAIADGEVYQVNLTAPLDGRLAGDPLVLFAALRRAQPNAYAAWIDGGAAGETVISVSPELFFDWREGELLARPMKGTAARGAGPAEDAAARQRLIESVKERAENLMIVDLLRNDLSRVCEAFSVKVPRLFQAEAWPTLWQLTSDVTGRTRPGTSLVDVFRALFPCGSVTGAPKVQAMKLIRALEPAPRGVYCGAVGVIQPGGAATFNVPIRTLALRDGRVRCGIGSGITADARADDEWDEWRHKRAFVERASASFDLLETLRLDSGVLVHLDLHLARMARSAAHFGVVWRDAAARDAVGALAQRHGAGRWRVRLTSSRDGTVRADATALEADAGPRRVQLAARPMPDSDSEFVRHKTTRRGHYDAFAPDEPTVFDTLLWNERGELTEFTRGNVALRVDGAWLTPAAGSGLLPGIARALLLGEGRLREATLRRDDLSRADGLAFVNSLRGWLPVELVERRPPPG